MLPARPALRDLLAAALGRLRQTEPAVPLLDDFQLDQLTAYLDLVVDYNRAAQLTGLRSASQLPEELAAESLRLLALGELPRGAQLLDLGSGNGSPVIPLAIAAPEVDCAASEVRARRVAFLQLCQVKLRLMNLHVHDGPVEQLEPQRGGRWDVLTSRAFAPPARLLPLAVKLLGGQGDLRGFLGAEAAELREAAAVHGFEVVALRPYESAGRQRHFYLLRLN